MDAGGRVAGPFCITGGMARAKILFYPLEADKRARFFQHHDLQHVSILVDAVDHSDQGRHYFRFTADVYFSVFVVDGR